LAGFSQGGAMTLDVGLTFPMAGLCSLSGYLHSQPQGNAIAIPPVFVVHGKQDLVVPIQAAQKAKDVLNSMGVTVEYHELAMGHEIIPEVLTLMQNFILC
jgi:phospholipase/carboxylesterase